MGQILNQTIEMRAQLIARLMKKPATKSNLMGLCGFRASEDYLVDQCLKALKKLKIIDSQRCSVAYGHDRLTYFITGETAARLRAEAVPVPAAPKSYVIEDSVPSQLGPLVERLLKYSDIRRTDPRENREALRDLIVGELADELQATRATERERCAAEIERLQAEFERKLLAAHMD